MFGSQGAPTFTVTGFVCVALIASSGSARADHVPPVFLMDNTSVTTCSGIFLDSGGDPPEFPGGDVVGRYGNFEDFTKTFIPDDPGTQKLRFEFVFFELEESPPLPANPFDRLEIYDGNSLAAPPIGVFFLRKDFMTQAIVGGSVPDTVTSTAADGSLTFRFVSDSGTRRGGWKAIISCVPARTVTFATTGQSLWGPGVNARPPNSPRFEFLTVDFNDTRPDRNVVSVLGKSFGGGWFAGATGDVGFLIRASDISAGGVSVRYPVEVTFIGPEQDSFRTGDLITIETRCRVSAEDAPSLSTVTPEMVLDVDSRIRLTANATLEFCFFSCRQQNLFPSFNLHAGPIQVVNIQDRAGGDLATIAGFVEAGETPITIPNSFPLFVEAATGVGGTLDTPNLATPRPTSTFQVAGKTLVTSANDQFLHLRINVDSYYTKALGIKVPLKVDAIDLGSGVRVGYTILDYDKNIHLLQPFTFRFAPTVHVSLAFPQPVQFTVRRGGGVVTSGVSAVVEFDAGDTLELIAPDAPLDAIPTFSLTNPTFINQNTTIFRRNYTFRALALNLRVPSVELACWPVPKKCISSPSFNINFGPLINITVPNAENADPRLFGPPQRVFPLQGFNPIAGAPVSVDPEFAPVAMIDAPPNPVNEGDVLNFSAANSFDGDNDPLTYTWDFGDGGAGIGPTTGVDLTHAYGHSGVYTVTLIVDDGHGVPGVATHVMIVNNVAPTLPAPPGDQTVLEGELVRVFPGSVDPGFGNTFISTIDGGDGAPPDVFDSRNFIANTPLEPLTHFYADDGMYSLSYCVADDDGAEVCGNLTVTVNNAPPTVSVQDFDLTRTAINLGEHIEVGLRVAATFNDPGTLDTHVPVVLRWDDGSPDDPIPFTEAPFGPPGSGSGADGRAGGTFTHVYDMAGSYDLQVCVSDDDGAETCEVITTLDVPQVDLQIVKAVDPVEATAAAVGTPLTYTLTVTNNDLLETVDDVRVTDVLPANTELVSAVRGGTSAIETKLSPGDLITPGGDDIIRQSDGSFGESLAISGDTIAVGAPVFRDAAGRDGVGAVYVYESSGADWSELTKLTRPGGGIEFSGFGADVAIDGSTLVALDNIAAYVFQRAGGTWTEQATLTADDAVVGDPFGTSVAISGDTIVVGAPLQSAAYVFERNEGGLDNWGQVIKLTSADVDFGGDVSLSGDTLVVAAVGDGSIARPGSATVFRRSPTWTQEARLTEMNVTLVQEPNTFAASVAIDGDTLVVGTNEQSAAGAAHVFLRTGTTWAEQAKLLANDATPGDGFGQSVAIDGDTVVVGAHLADLPVADVGAAYVFGRTGSHWSQLARLTPGTGAVDDRFGISVDVDGDTFVGGAPAVDAFFPAFPPQSLDVGAAFVFAICRESPPGTAICGLGELGPGESRQVQIVARIGCVHAATVPGSLLNTASVAGLGIDPTRGNNTDTVTSTTALPAQGVCGADFTPPVIAPVITGTLGENGWYTSDVTVDWVVTDPDSIVSIDSGCQATVINVDTAGTTLTCEATSTGGTADNEVTIRRDATPPVITPITTGTLGNNDWHITDVEASFDCTDGTSGVASCTGPTMLTDEGLAPTLIGVATDEAGNTATATASGIKIDTTAPIITASRTPVPNNHGWNDGPVTVTFDCLDGLSGIESCLPTTETVSTEGQNQSVTGTAIDRAGHEATLVVDDINIDTTSPTIVAAASPAPNLNDWNNSIVTVSFACNDSLAGIDTCSPDATLAAEGAGQSASGTAVDLAGNTASTTQSNINLDLSPPTINAAVSPPPDANGQNDPPVTVSFVCADTVSGVANCPPNEVLNGFGFGQSASGTVTDRAGNSASASVSDINIGRPVLAAIGNTALDEGVLLDAILATVNPLAATSGTATIDWGDGSLTEAGTVTPVVDAGDIRGSHIFADNGNYTIEVCVEDLGGRPICESLEVTVTNRPPALQALDTPADPVELHTMTRITALFNDPGTADTHVATIDWGDGTAPESSPAPDIAPVPASNVRAAGAPFGPPGSLAGANGTVEADHTYTQPGDHAGQICIEDDEGGLDCLDFTVSVRPLAPPACHIDVVPTQCSGTTATVALQAHASDGQDFPVLFTWRHDNPTPGQDSGFDRQESATTTLTVDVTSDVTVTCIAAFPIGSGLALPDGWVECQALIPPCPPDLQIAKDADTFASNPGETIVYTLSFENVGGQDATGVRIVDTVPANTTFHASASTPGWSCIDGAPAGTPCTFTIGPLAARAPDSVDFAVTVDSSPPVGAIEFENTASIADDGTHGVDPNLTNNTAITTTVSCIHPVDTNGNSDVEPSEISGYETCFLQACTDWPGGGPLPPRPGYIARAATLFLRGRFNQPDYCCDGSQPPPLSSVPPGQCAAAAATAHVEGVEALGEYAARRETRRNASTVDVLIRIRPPVHSNAYAIEERVSPGSIVTEVSGGGQYHATLGSIRWGPFLDNTPRELTYRINGVEGLESTGSADGIVSFDGHDLPIESEPSITTLPGDADHDGDIDLADFLRLVECFSATTPIASGCEELDLDADNDIDLVDLLTFQASFTGPG